jgi:hypothetical protein
MVAGATGTQPEGGGEAAEHADRTPWIIGVLLIASLLLGLRLGPSLYALGRAKAASWRASEGYAFRVLDRACKRAAPATIEKRLVLWLDRIEPGLAVAHMALWTGQSDLARAAAPLQRTLHGRGADGLLVPEERRALRAALRLARGAYLTRRSANASAAKLPSLNPT